MKTGTYESGISCHDPQVIEADGKFYMTGSHMVLAESEDLVNWKMLHNGSNLFTNIFSGDLPAFAYVGKNDQDGYSVWASNIFYSEETGEYRMYFCTTSTYIVSSLTLAVSDRPEGPYTYTDTFLCSGFKKKTVDRTNFYEIMGEDADLSPYLHLGGYDNTKWPNCIDPAVFRDADNRQWLVYGSWSGGIFLLELDPQTGLPIHPEADEEKNIDKYFGYHLIGGGHHPIEGPYIEYCPENGYYYLFVSYGELRTEGGYQIREFRSKSPTGPYLDPSGSSLGDEDAYFLKGLKVMGNYTLPSLDRTYMAPGGQSVLTSGGNFFVTYHQRFNEGTEYHEPRIHQLVMTEDDWLVAAPFETDGKGVEYVKNPAAVLSGEVYLLDHGLDVDNKVNEALPCVFADGQIYRTGTTVGSYENLPGTEGGLALTFDGQAFSCIVFSMVDEAGNDVVCISGAGDNNHAIWGLMYPGQTD